MTSTRFIKRLTSFAIGTGSFEVGIGETMLITLAARAFSVVAVVVIDEIPYPFKELRDNSVSESSKSVHPSGYPMSHSTHVGFN